MKIKPPVGGYVHFLEIFFNKHKDSLTIEQTLAYDTIMNSINTNAEQLYL